MKTEQSRTAYVRTRMKIISAAMIMFDLCDDDEGCGGREIICA